MDIVFSCRTCGTKYSVPETLAGRLAECKKCGQRMSVPYRSPVVKLGDEMVIGGEDATPAVVRTFEEYEPLRKNTKQRGPKMVAAPFAPLPALVTDLWLPLSVAALGYGMTAYLLLSYVFGSNGVTAGLILLVATGLLFWIGVVPLGRKMVEAASDSFGFEGSNFLLMQVVGVLALPVWGITQGALAGGLNAAIAFGLIGCALGILLMAVVLQTSAGNGFQTAILSMLVSCLSLGIVILFVWGIGLFLIPRWGLTLPWQPSPSEAVAIAPQPVPVPPKSEVKIPAVVKVPEVVLAAAPVKISQPVVRVQQPSAPLRVVAVRRWGAFVDKIRSAFMVAMIQVEATIQTPEFRRSMTPLADLAKKHEWLIVVESVGREDTTELTDTVNSLRKDSIEAKKLAANARSEAIRMEGEKSKDATTTVDTLGRRRLVYRNVYSANEISKARGLATRLESDARIAAGKYAAAEKNLLAVKDRRIIRGVSPSGWPVTVTVESPVLAKIAEEMSPSSVWSVKGMAKAGVNSLTVKGNFLKPRETSEVPVVATPRHAVPRQTSEGPLVVTPRRAAPETAKTDVGKPFKKVPALFEVDERAFER